MLDVSNMRIYELRDYARKVGVKSPTSKTKKVLIKEIELITQGKQKPFVTSKGRKPIVSFALTEKNQQFLMTELEKLKTNLKKNIDSLIGKMKARK
ncbi:MAG: hypothetical protein ACOX6H_00310 [Christensenellales bacterium]|jgi:hypothetical protein